MANVHQPFLWNCITARRFSGITNQIRDAGAGACVHFANPSGQGERPGFMTESCHSYTVYGLRVASDKPVLEFEPPDFFAFPDIRILWSASGEPAPDFGDRDWCFHLGPDNATLGFLGVGVFRIPDCSTITVESDPGADHRMVERYLAGVVFAVLLHLRGAVVYHAAANAVSDAEAIAFVGDSGAGKSTLSALLHLRGCRCLTDDVLPARVDRAGVFVSRGYPRVKIDPEFAVRHDLAAIGLGLGLAAVAQKQTGGVEGVFRYFGEFADAGGGNGRERADVVGKQSVIEGIRPEHVDILVFHTIRPLLKSFVLDWILSI